VRLRWRALSSLHGETASREVFVNGVNEGSEDERSESSGGRVSRQANESAGEDEVVVGGMKGAAVLDPVRRSKHRSD